jgi:hypothetical protein
MAYGLCTSFNCSLSDRSAKRKNRKRLLHESPATAEKRLCTIETKPQNMASAGSSSPNQPAFHLCPWRPMASGSKKDWVPGHKEYSVDGAAVLGKRGSRHNEKRKVVMRAEWRCRRTSFGSCRCFVFVVVLVLSSALQGFFWSCVFGVTFFKKKCRVTGEGRGSQEHAWGPVCGGWEQRRGSGIARPSLWSSWPFLSIAPIQIHTHLKWGGYG